MAYLMPAEYEAYGLTTETADAWVIAASAMMEAFCRRSSLTASTYVERLRVRRAAGAIRLSYRPLLSVTGVRARFTASGLFGGADAELAAAFCTPGSWVDVDVSSVDVDTVLGIVTLPCNVLGAQYGEVEVSYTAGFAEVPQAVKVACAQIVKNAQATPGLNVRQSRVDTLQMQYFSDSLIDSQVKALLQPYVAERLS